VVTLWNLADSAELRFHGQTLSRHNGTVNSVALTPDGQALAMVRNGVASTDSAVILWDLSNPTQPRPLGQPLTGHSGSVTSVAFSSDG
jgi:WD40 repeat protein